MITTETKLEQERRRVGTSESDGDRGKLHIWRKPIMVEEGAFPIPRDLFYLTNRMLYLV